MSSESTLTPKIWQMARPDAGLEAEFVRSLSVPPLLCRILLNRGIRSVDEARRFLKPDLDQLHDPSLLDGVDWAVERTREALDRKEKIMVHGDYDVDGVTSTALVVRVLRILGADVSWYIPHRRKEGYDLGMPGVDAALERGVTLIVTVDCGTSSVEAVGHARSRGIDVIITDHHEVGTEVAPGNVLINPRKPGCTYPFKELAGVGVAFKFGEALIRACGYDVSAYRRRFCDLAAVGTVADVVPLLDENRAIVTVGMQELARTGKKGLRALMDVAGVTGKPITSHSLAFALAPRLNAAGRLDHASVALRLLLTNDEGEAVELAQQIDRQNRDRQAEQERITREALEQIAARGLDDTKVLVLSSQGWHSGIVGVVASKITDRYCRPSILVAMDEAGTAGVGSARSIRAFDIFGALMRCEGLLERCGGHSQAAGLSITSAKLAEFDTAINLIADDILTETDMLPMTEVDSELPVDSVTRELAHELRVLEPFGHHNREPVFVSRRALVLQRSRMGSGAAHLKMRLGGTSSRSVECVAFGWGECEQSFMLGSSVDVCYNIRINEYNGSETVQAMLKDARPSDG